jgi:hypothetical protein
VFSAVDEARVHPKEVLEWVLSLSENPDKLRKAEAILRSVCFVKFTLRRSGCFGLRLKSQTGWQKRREE